MNHLMAEVAEVPAAWDAVIELWRAWALAGGSPATTVRTRWEHLRRLARTCGVEHPRQVTTEGLVTWCGRQPWATETRRSHRTTFRAFWRWALPRGHVDVDAAAALPVVRPSPPRPSPAPDRVYASTLSAAEPRVRLMVRLAAELGMRRAEVAQVHARDLVEDLTGWSLLVHGKGGRERMVPMPPGLATAVRTWLSEQGGGWLFPGDDHGHLSPRWVGQLVGRSMPEGWTMHKLRHRAAARVHEASGHDLALTQDFLGHASPVTTRIYVPVADGRLRAAVESAA